MHVIFTTDFTLENRIHLEVHVEMNCPKINEFNPESGEYLLLFD